MKKKIITVSYLLLLFVVSFSAAYFIGIYNNVHVSSKTFEIKSSLNLNPTPTPDPLGPKNILLLGYGGLEHDGSLLTDTVIVAHIVPKESRVTLISIPRDLWVPLPIKSSEEKYFKINHAYAIGVDSRNYPDKDDYYKGEAGGGNMAKYAISYATGLEINNFISIDFSGFKNSIDYLGGIDINIPYSFEDPYYPVKGLENETCGKSDEEIKSLSATMSGELLEKEFPCRYETLNFTKGRTHLDGETTLKFVRSRHSEVGGSDFGRALRQQAFIIALKDKILSYKSLPKIIPLFTKLSKYTLTDIDLLTVFDLMGDVDFENIEIKTISLNTDNVLKEDISPDHQYILLPKEGNGDWSKVHGYIKTDLEADLNQ